MELLCVYIYIYRYISLTILSKEIEKLNFRQYGQMKSRAGQRQREEKVQKRKSQKKEDADARKGRKIAIHCVFPMICGSGGSKSRLAKAAGVETYGEMRHEKIARRCGAKHISKTKCTKHQRIGALLALTFGASDVEKVHAVVARSTSPSQNVQNIPGSDHFWKLRCRKSAHRYGAKYMSKSKYRKRTKCGPLLALKMSKKYTPLWREAHFQVKMLKTLGGSDHFWRLRGRVSKKCTPLWHEAHFEVRTTFGGSEVEFRKSVRRYGTKHISKSKCTKHQGFEPLLEAQRSSFEKKHAAYFEVKMYKPHHVRTTFRGWDIEFRKSTRRCGAKKIWKLTC